MNDLITILLGLVFPFSLLLLGAKSVEIWSKRDGNVDVVLQEDRPFFVSTPFIWIMIFVFYGTVAATFIFNNMVYAWLSGGILAVVIFARIAPIFRRIGLRKNIAYMEVNQPDQELKDVEDRIKDE